MLPPNVKGPNWRKRRERRGGEKEEEKNIVKKNKAAINMYLSIIIFNVNDLNVPIKKHGVAKWIRK